MVTKCCANCIGDRYLRTEVIPIHSTEVGTCSYCYSGDEKLLDPKILKDYFDLVLSVYIKQDGGASLVKLLKVDWLLFDHPEMNDANAQMLLSDILDDGNITRQKFVRSPICHSDSLARWNEFREELMHKNRFFPQTDIEHNRLGEWLEHLIIPREEIPNTVYRARLQVGNKMHLQTEMGAPPAHLAAHGRASPAGIPYLYLASDIQTAISEIRPHTGEKATVAEFFLDSDIKLVDLRQPRRTVSPFILEDDNAVATLMGDISLLEYLGNELTRPVLPSAAAVDYVPSQYLCEFLKHRGYDGVMYRSSVGNGRNIALFNPKLASIMSVSEHYVEKVSVETKPI